MRKTVALITLVVLVATMVVPVAALAIGPPPGKGPDSTPPGLAKKADKGEPGSKGTERSEQARERAQLRSAEETGTPEGKRRSARGKEQGIDNARSRITRNIERAEARVEAGEQSHVPQGLSRVLEKFLGWLGIGQESQTVEPELE